MIPALLLAAAVVITLWAAAGVSGVLYLVLYAVAIAPGTVFGVAICGRRDPTGWIGGALVGYGMTQIALWMALAAGIPSRAGLLACWALTGVAFIAIARIVRQPLPVFADWTSADTRALCLVLMLVPVLMAPPYRNIGKLDENGTRYYRAYFTADFVWHTALASELGKHAMPPRNPYLAPKPIHYYWTYFLLPAIVAHDGPAKLRDVQSALKSNAIACALLVIASLFVLARAAVPRAWAAGLAVALAVLAASAEGAWTLLRLIRAGAPIGAVRELNIDAISAWQFQGLRIDGLPRSLWYNPQHSIACALGLLALTIAATAGAAAPRRHIAFAGTALALSTCMNPFVGAVCSLIYGLAVLWHIIAERLPFSRTFEHLLAALPVGAAVLWCVANQMADGAGASLRIGFVPRHPLITLLLSVGPVLVPAIAGCWGGRDLPRQPRRVAATGLIVALLLLHFVTLGDEAWVGFRAGQLLLLTSAVLLARALWLAAARARPAAIVLTAIVLIAGLPTTVIDEFNAQDTRNRGMGAGFRWTVTLSAAQQEAVAWIRTHVPEDAVVQMEPVIRGRDQWSFIPSFAERRMAAGLPISLVAQPEYAERSNAVRQMFAATDIRAAWNVATRLRIAYVYADATDRAAYPDGVRKFAASNPYFETVFDNGEAAVYRTVR